MRKPLISIIVPIYNVEDYLDECLASIAKQTSNNFIALLINDGSKDNSETIAKHYVEKHPDLFQFYNKENGGLSDARNYGINKTDTDYIMFVDSDDIIALDTIETISNELSNQPSDILCFGMTEISEAGHHIRNIPPTTGSLDLTTLHQSPSLIIEAMPNACNKVIKTTLFKTHNIEFPKGLWYEDLATIPKLFHQAQAVSFMANNLYHYRTRAGSITQTISPKILDMTQILTLLDSYFYEHKNDEITKVLLILKLNMLMKTLVRISACTDKEQQLVMLNKVQIYLSDNMPNSYAIMAINSKFVYKLTITLAVLKLNKLVLAFLSLCLKKGLVRA